MKHYTNFFFTTDAGRANVVEQNANNGKLKFLCQMDSDPTEFAIMEQAKPFAEPKLVFLGPQKIAEILFTCT